MSGYGWFEIRRMAIRAMRENYRWKGVWVLLRATVPEYVQFNHVQFGKTPKVFDPQLKTWKLLLRDPDTVLAWQQGLAEGVFI